MSRTGYDTFARVAHFIDNIWVPCHVTLGLFEEKSTAGARLAKTLKHLLDKYKLLKKVICCVKDERAYLKTLQIALESVVTCDPLGLDKLHVGTCFGHVMSKAC